MPMRSEQHPEMQDLFLKAYEDHADAIFRHVLFRVFDRDRAKDLTQECFTRTWERLVAGTKIENIRAFLYRTAVNLVIDESRRHRPESLEVAMESGFEPSAGGISVPESAEAARAVAAIGRLDEPYREALRLRYVDGLGPSDIAAITGESENVISVRLNRGMKMLKDIFNQ